MAQTVTQNLSRAVQGSNVLGRCQDEAQGSLACWEGEARAPGFVLRGGRCSGLLAQDELAA